MQNNLEDEQSRQSSSTGNSGLAGPGLRQTAAEVENARLRQALKECFEQLKVYQAYLARVESIPEKGRALREMGHQLNNSLTAIIGWLDMLKYKPGDESFKQQVVNIARRADEADALVLGMGKLSREVSSSLDGLPALPSKEPLEQIEQLLNSRDNEPDIRDRDK